VTGKELILYILQNNLEDTVVLNGGVFIGFMTEEEAAVKFGVGVGMIKAWYYCDMLKGTQVGDSVYFRKDAVDPRTTLKTRNGV
jgi:hypothetical protein